MTSMKSTFVHYRIIDIYVDKVSTAPIYLFIYLRMHIGSCIGMDDVTDLLICLHTG